MSELFFVIKVFLFSVVVMAVLQIKIGDHNIEQHSQNWLHSSSLVQILNTVSIGASHAITDGYRYVRGEVGAKFGGTESKTPKKQTSSGFHGIDIRHEFHQVSTEVKSAINKEKARISEEAAKDIKMIDESEL